MPVVTVFVFQTTSVSQGTSKTCAQMEAKFLSTKLTVGSLMAFLDSVVQFSSNKDAKSQAFCYQAALWLEENAVNDQWIQALKEIYESDLKNNPQFISQLFHYMHLFDVVKASRAEDGSVALPPAPIAKLTEILDVALENAQKEKLPGSKINVGRYYFVFASEGQAREFKEVVLSSLPKNFVFNSKVGKATDIFGGNGFVLNRDVSNSYAVELTCRYDAAIASDVALKATKVSLPKLAYGPSGYVQTTEKRTALSTQYTGAMQTVSDKEIIDYSKKPVLSLKGNGNGEMKISGLAEFWYGHSYNIDPDKDKERAQDLVKEQFRYITERYGYDVGNYKSLGDFFALEEGKEFIGKFNSNSPTIKASASIEVFYTGNNYGTFMKAVVDNWSLAKKRATLISDEVNAINSKLGDGSGLNPEFKPSLYFFQDLPGEVMDRLINDKTIPTDLRDYLKENRADLNGKAHMEGVLTYLRANPGEDNLGAYGKLIGAIGKENVSENEDGTVVIKDMGGANFSLLNQYFLRSSLNKEGLRVEDRKNQSLLVKAIEDGGDGTSRAGLIFTTSKASIEVNLETTLPEGDRVEVEKGGKFNLEANVYAVRSADNLGKIETKAFLVDKEDNVKPMVFNEDTKKWNVDGGVAPGEYTIVAYAESEDSKIVTSLVGKRFSVEEKAEVPVKKDPVFKATSAPQTRYRFSGSDIIKTPINVLIPGYLILSPEFEGHEQLNKDIAQAYSKIGVTYDPNNGPSPIPSNLTGDQLVAFWSANAAAWELWNENPKNHQFLVDHLNGGEADVEAFFSYIRSGQFPEAKKLANGELLSAIGGAVNTTSTEVILNSADIVRLMNHHISYGGGFSVNIGKNKPVKVITFEKEKIDEYAQDYAETYKITEKQIEKMKALKASKSMAFTAKDGKEYIARASTDGESIAVYNIPSQKKLDIYLRKDGYFFVTNQAIDVLTLGAGMLIGSIDVGKFDLSLTGGVEGSQSVLRSDPENWLLTSPNLEDNKTYNVGKTYAGAQISYPLGKEGVLEIFVDACGAATFGQEYTPQYTANLGAGARANLGGLYLGISLSKMFEPENSPITVAGGNIGYSSTWGNLDISGGFYLDPTNIQGKNPYFIGAKVTFDLEDVVGVFKKKR